MCCIFITYFIHHGADRLLQLVLTYTTPLNRKKKDTKRPSPIDPMIISRALMFLDYPKLINPSLAPGTDLQVTQHNVMEGKESVPQTKYLFVPANSLRSCTRRFLV